MKVTENKGWRIRETIPVVGRFLQEDTYRGDGLNLYAYCANNPVSFFDPSGHQKCNKDNGQKERVGRQKGDAPRNNKAQNKQIDAVVRELGLNKKQRRLLHEEISGEGYGYQLLLEIAKDMFER